MTTMHSPIKIRIEPTNPPEALLRELEQSRWRLRYTDPLYVYHCIWLGGESFCGVFGDGPNGAYEWFVWRDGKLVTSDVGYGSTEAALRSALTRSALTRADA